MKRLFLIGGTVAAMGLSVVAIGLRPGFESKPWKTSDVWYHESDLGQIGRTGRPQLVEFFHPD